MSRTDGWSLLFSFTRKKNKASINFLSLTIRSKFHFMKGRIFPSNSLLLCFVFWSSFHGLSNAYSQTETKNGIQPLVEIGQQLIIDFIPPSIQPLVSSEEIEIFLRKLEIEPPDWTQLHHADITKQSERIFQFNRQRDRARSSKNALTEQPLAFLWAGILRQYLPEYQGFSIALGPELTNSSWGIIRFKPINLPDYLVAIPSPNLRKHLLIRQQQGEQLEIIVVFMGTLIPDESLIYGFSHDGHQKGMIMPVVSVQNMLYILKPS